jgi:hypothetical protein
MIMSWKRKFCEAYEVGRKGQEVYEVGTEGL